MKTKFLITLIAAGTITIGIVGCKKEESNVPPAVQETKSVTDKAVDAVKDVAADAKAGAEKAVEAVKEAAAPAPAVDKADGIIAQAKELLTAGKLQDALTTLGELKGMTLSEAQQKIVDGLKEQIQKAIADKAAAQGASAVGNLLGK